MGNNGALVNNGAKGYRRRRRRKFFYTTSASLPDVQIFYTTSASLRRTENRFSGINYAGTSSPCSTYRTLPPRAFPAEKKEFNIRRIHAGTSSWWPRNFSSFKSSFPRLLPGRLAEGVGKIWRSGRLAEVVCDKLNFQNIALLYLKTHLSNQKVRFQI